MLLWAYGCATVQINQYVDAIMHIQLCRFRAWSSPDLMCIKIVLDLGTATRKRCCHEFPLRFNHVRFLRRLACHQQRPCPSSDYPPPSDVVALCTQHAVQGVSASTPRHQPPLQPSVHGIDSCKAQLACGALTAWIFTHWLALPAWLAIPRQAGYFLTGYPPPDWLCPP